MRDLSKNLKVMNFLAPATKTPGASDSSTIDTQAALTSSDMRENITNMLLVAQITFAATSTVDLVVKHSDDNVTFTTHKTVAQMLQTEGVTAYYAEIKDFKRYVKVTITVGTANATMSLVGIGNQSRVKPVVQGATEKAVS